MKEIDKSSMLAITSEFSGVELGDERRAKRLRKIVGRVALRPAASLPETMTSSSELEGTYRFLNSDAFGLQDIIRGHVQATSERARAYDQVLVVHDWTQFGLSSKRKGMGPLASSDEVHGFLSNVSFCVGLGRQRDPLGIVGVQAWSRTDQGKKMRAATGKTEAEFWRRGVRNANEVLNGMTKAVHVMDRGADSYGLFHDLLTEDADFIIRASQNRIIESGKKLFELAQEAPVIAQREAPVIAQREASVSARKNRKALKQQKVFPARRQREARLELKAIPVTLKRTSYLDGRSDIQKSLELNLVYVREVDCPEGEPPVEWYLLTTMSIESAEDVENIVDAYRARWLIEELFKALKTGCQFLKLQLESYDAFLKALGIYLPVAWLLLRLRYLSGQDVDLPASHVLSPIQITLLGILAEKRLPNDLSLRDALLLIAARGGHIKNNGDPGWLVL
jgi:hypothetical protein